MPGAPEGPASPDQSSSDRSSPAAVDPSPLGPRSPTVAVVGVALAVLTVLALVALALWAVTRGDDEPSRPPSAVLTDAVAPAAALAPLPGGGLLAGERLTGRIVRVAPDGSVAAEPVAVLDIEGAEDDQRGLVGLVVDPDDPERVFAAWTRADDGRLVVGQVAPGPTRIVWEGPTSSDLANGGHLVWRAGRIVTGIGDLQERELLADPTAPNGKVISLDPNGPPGQAFEVLSTGWNNPFALAVDVDGGEVWVADNAGGSGFERFGRADVDDAPTTDLTPADEPIAPSGLVALGDGRFALCGYVSGRLDEVAVDSGRARRTGRVLADECRLGAAALSDGRLVVSTGAALRTVPAP